MFEKAVWSEATESVKKARGRAAERLDSGLIILSSKFIL
jgi:hypothetical protein